LYVDFVSCVFTKFINSNGFFWGGSLQRVCVLYIGLCHIQREIILLLSFQFGDLLFLLVCLLLTTFNTVLNTHGKGVGTLPCAKSQSKAMQIFPPTVLLAVSFSYMAFFFFFFLCQRTFLLYLNHGVFIKKGCWAFLNACLHQLR
jgi:hypothetical protein